MRVGGVEGAEHRHGLHDVAEEVLAHDRDGCAPIARAASMYVASSRADTSCCAPPGSTAGCRSTVSDSAAATMPPPNDVG